MYCFDEQNFQIIDCPVDNVWDDCQKRCILAPVSPTCVECYEGGDIVSNCEISTSTPAPTPPPTLCRATGSSCITACGGKPDGFYQWCARCDYYIACVAQILTIQPCPVNSPWDDCNKRCDVSSNTCVECDNNGELVVNCEQTSSTTAIVTASTTPGGVDCESTGEVCIRSCNGVIDGNYQYCGNCRQFVQCSNGAIYLQSCSSGLFWDDSIKNCIAQSTTCTECYIDKPTESW
jgi:hypothetical protein